MINFIIRTSPRSGTHMLRTALNMHPNIFTAFCDPWRLPNDITIKHPEELLNYLYYNCEYFHNKNNVDKNIHGIIMHGNDNQSFNGIKNLFPCGCDVNEFINYTEDNFLCINLFRRNILKATISRIQTETTKQWHLYTSIHNTLDIETLQNKFADIYVSVDILFSRLNDYVVGYKEYTKRNKTNNITVWYEDLVCNWDTEINNIQSFIGVKKLCSLKPSTIKTGVGLDRSVSNYDELRAATKGTEFDHFWDEP